MGNTADEHDDENPNENPNENDNENEKNEKRRKRRHESAEEHAEQVKSAQPSGPTFAATEPQVHDLSAELIRTLPRSEGELIRCRRISGNRYRCNWWGAQNTNDYDNPAMAGLIVTTHRVIRSRMLRATQTEQGLIVENDPQQ